MNLNVLVMDHNCESCDICGVLLSISIYIDLLYLFYDWEIRPKYRGDSVEIF